MYHSEYKGVRLDVYAKDENHTHYNVEMQAIKEEALGKRSRYYHSQLDMELLDERTSIFLSTKGENEDEVPVEMVKFLKYVSAGLEESMQDFGDGFIRRLQSSVQSVKTSREMEGRYMGFQEMLKQQYNAGKAEGRAEYIVLILECKGSVSEELKERIKSEKDLNTLMHWFQKALEVQYVEDFMEVM